MCVAGGGRFILFLSHYYHRGANVPRRNQPSQKKLIIIYWRLDYHPTMTRPTTQPTANMTDQPAPAMTEPPKETAESMADKISQVLNEINESDNRTANFCIIADAEFRLRSMYTQLVLLRYPRKVAMKKICAMARLQTGSKNGSVVTGNYIDQSKFVDTISQEIEVITNGNHINRFTKRQWSKVYRN
jgi:hypothetical protein